MGPALTDLQPFTLYNTLCLSAVVVVSALVMRWIVGDFFRFWLRATLFSVGTSVTELLASLLGRSLALDLFQYGFATAAAWWLYRAAATYPAGNEPASRRRVVAAGLLAALALAVGARLGGVPHEVACLPAMLAYASGYAYLGVRLLLVARQSDQASAGVLAWSMIGFVLSLLTYPVMINTPYFWVGFVVTGMFQFSMGIGVAVYVLGESASRLTEQNERLVRLDGLKDQLLANVSHELRTPITAIKTASHMLSEDFAEGLSPAQAELLAIIDRSNDQLARRVGDMIDYSLLDSGLMTYDWRETELGALLVDAVSPFGPEFASKGVALQLASSEGPLHAVVDPHRVAQVVQNLLANALKYTPPGGEVRVRAYKRAASVVLEVADTGEGLSAEHSARVFDRFYRAEAHGVRRADGFGLGLAIVRAIVEDGHGGEIALASAPGRGTCLSVSLPAQRPPRGRAISP